HGHWTHALGRIHQHGSSLPTFRGSAHSSLAPDRNCLGKLNGPEQLTPALTLPQVRYGLSMLLLEGVCALSIASICRHVQRQLMRNELARFYHRTRNGVPPKKLHRDIQ